MYTMTTSEVQNFLTTDFMPVKVNANADANRGVYVFMVTSGGSSYPDGTYYTKLRGDTTGGIARLVVSGGAIRFGNADASNSYMHTKWNWIFLQTLTLLVQTFILMQVHQH